MNSLDELKVILSNILERKSMTFENRLAESIKSFKKQELEEIYIKNVTSLLESLDIMHKEKIITTQQFNSRVSSLLDIVKLVDEVKLVYEVH